MNNVYPLWKTWIWRLLRGAVASAVAQTVLSACGTGATDLVSLIACVPSVLQKWGDPKTAVTMIAIALISGFFLALGVAIRDSFGGEDQGGLVHKLPF